LLKDTQFRRFVYHNGYLLVIAAWLVTLSFIVDNYWSVNASVTGAQNKIATYLHQQERDFESFTTDTAAVNLLAKNKYNAEQLKRYLAKNYSLFIYPAFEPWQQSVLFWNTQTIQPDSAIINNSERCGFKMLGNGYYVWRRKVVGNYLCVALMPIKWKYRVPDTNLDEGFAAGENIAAHYDITETGGATAVKAHDGTNLFYLSQKEVVTQEVNAWPAALMRILAALCVLLFLHLLAHYLSQRYGPWQACGFLIGTILLLRILSYYFPLPLNMRQFELFDPTIYGGGDILRSLGDLLINAICFIWLTLFVRQQLFEKSASLPRPKPVMAKTLLVLGTILLTVATLMAGHMVRSLVADSQISFDVVDFTSLNGYSVAGFLGLCSIAMGYFLFAQLVLFFMKPLMYGKINYLHIHLALIVVGLLLLSLRIGNGHIEFEFCLMIWLQVFLFFFNNRLVAMPDGRMLSTQLIFWLIYFSASLTAAIIEENAVKEMENREHYAVNLSNIASSRNERMMNSMLIDFRAPSLAINFGLFADSASNVHTKDSLLRNNIRTYQNTFRTRVYTYDATMRPLHNEDTTTFNALNTIVTTAQAKRTSIPDLFTYNVSFDQFNYIFKREVVDTGRVLQGYIFIVVTPKNNEVGGLMPELFLQGEDKSIENSAVYSYAVYDNLQLVEWHNDNNFVTTLRQQDIPQAEFKRKNEKGYNELWYRGGTDKVVVIVRKDNFFIASITLFSYLFCAFLLVTAFFWLLNAFIRARFKKQRWKEYWQLNIRNQVHATVIFISVLSFLVIGLATVVFFKNRYESNKREELSKTMQLIEKEIRGVWGKIVAFDDVIGIDDAPSRPVLDSVVQRMSEVHDMAINLYDTNGNLTVTSIPPIYQMGVFSEKMDPEAYFHLHELKAAQFFKKESIARLSYISNYVPVSDDRGIAHAYLNVPYYKSVKELKQEISSFFVAIINLNAFIFLIAGVVALFIANRITRSFSFISDKMKEVNLGKMNEAIEWKRNDEIGNLVEEYNKMVAKLDESAAALAKSEREGAWREMARQVAHEIKNPLTPMKLSLQYLQKAINNNAPNVQELSASVSQTIVDQIDHLSQIASEFSQFANIGNPKKEWFDLNEVLRQLVQLYTADNMQMDSHICEESVMIYADRTQLNRLFTNLLQNAIQAVPTNRTPVICVKNYVKDNRVTVEVSDNGNGIPESVQAHIFIPNFTTKTSGTGLGLAMCKGIVEQAHGQIWFETQPDKGTTFYVSLPLEG